MGTLHQMLVSGRPRMWGSFASGNISMHLDSLVDCWCACIQVVGCSGYGIIGGGGAGSKPVEVESSPAMSITLANFGYTVGVLLGCGKTLDTQKALYK